MSMSAADRERAGGVVIEEYLETGFNYRMTDIQCALGTSQMARIDGFLQRRRAIAARYDEPGDPLDRVPLAVSAEAIAELRASVRRVLVSEDVARFAVRIVRATRAHPDVRLGASPRASVALHRASQAAAFLEGRSFVLPDDVVGVAPAVLGHRLLLDVDRELRGATAEDVVRDVLAEVPIPMPTAS